MDIKSNRYTLIISFSVFLFYAINQSVPSGSSYGSALLLLTSLHYLAERPALRLSAEDKAIVYALACFFAVAALVFILHDNPLPTLDSPSRFLLAIPIFLLLIKYPPRQSWLWAGVAIGAYSAFGVALWQQNVYGWTDVDGLSNGVRYGGICTILSVLCVAGLLWAQRSNVRRIWLWRLLLASGALAAAYGAIASGTRGAWISVPVVFILFCAGLLSKRNMYLGCTLAVALLVAVSTWYVAVPNNPIRAGYERATEDVSQYFVHRNTSGSIAGRLEAWRAVFINFPEKPILGWSVKDYKARLEQQVAAKELEPIVLTIPHTHNLYTETLRYQGIAGLVPILALFIFPFWFFCKRLRSRTRNVRILAIAGTSHLTVFGILGLSHTVLYRNDTLLFFFITLMVVWACMKREEALVSTPVEI